MAPLTDDIVSIVQKRTAKEIREFELSIIANELQQKREWVCKRLVKAFLAFGKFKTYGEFDKYIGGEKPFTAIHYLKYPKKEITDPSILLEAIVCVPESTDWDSWDEVVEISGITDTDYLDSILDEYNGLQQKDGKQRVFFYQKARLYFFPVAITGENFSNYAEKTDFVEGIESLKKVCVGQLNSLEESEIKE